MGIRERIQQLFAKKAPAQPQATSPSVVMVAPKRYQVREDDPDKERLTRGAYWQQQGRLNETLWFSFQSSDGEILTDMYVIRSLANWLAKNEPMAARYLEIVSSNVVGASGIAIQVKNPPKNGKGTNPKNAKIEDRFRDWSRAATVDGKLSWLEVQDWVIKATARDGECFIRHITGPDAGNQYGYAVQVLESMYLNHYLNGGEGALNNQGVDYSAIGVKPGNRVVMGIEMDNYNRPQAYYFWDPRDVTAFQPPQSARYIRVPADHVTHVFRPNASANQSRGISWLHPIMLRMKQYNDLLNAAMEAEYMMAAMPLFLTTDDAPGSYALSPTVGVNPGTGPGSPGASYPFMNGPGTNPMNADREFITVTAGTTTLLPPGMKPWQPNSNHPGSNFEPFTKQAKLDISAGLNVSYLSLTNDLSQGNNASSRTAQQVEHNYWRRISQWYIEQMIQPVFENWLQYSLLSPSFSDFDSKLPDDYLLDVRYVARGYTSFDPWKDARSYTETIQSGLTSRTAIINAMGGDPEQVFTELAEEYEWSQQTGINIDGPATNVAEVTAEGREGTFKPSPGNDPDAATPEGPLPDAVTPDENPT